MKKVLAWILVLMLAVTILCHAEELPAAYTDAFLATPMREAATLGDTVEITVDECLTMSYWDYHEYRYGESELQGQEEDYPLYCLIVELTVRNVGGVEIKGCDLVEGMTPIYFFYPTDVEDEVSGLDNWYDWNSLHTERHYKLDELDTSMDAIKTLSGETLPDADDFADITIKPGEAIEVVDIRGSLSDTAMQYYYFPIGYDIDYEGDNESIMLKEFSIDFNNTDCFIGDRFIRIDQLLKYPMTLEYDLIKKYKKTWGPLNGREMYLELTRAWQEEFGMEVTGILDQQLLGLLVHYSNTHNE